MLNIPSMVTVAARFNRLAPRLSPPSVLPPLYLCRSLDNLGRVIGCNLKVGDAAVGSGKTVTSCWLDCKAGSVLWITPAGGKAVLACWLVCYPGPLFYVTPPGGKVVSACWLDCMPISPGTFGVGLLGAATWEFKVKT